MKVVKLNDSDGQKFRHIFGEAINCFEIDYTLPLWELEKILDYAVKKVIELDPRFSKYRKKNILVYSGSNHIDVIEKSVGSLNFLTIEDHHVP